MSRRSTLAAITSMSADSSTRLVALGLSDYGEALKLIDATVEGRTVFR
jgi:hypothetical protein